MENQSSEEFDPYAELQLSPEAEPEIIKAAFKALAKKYHPDRFSNPNEKAEAEKKMAKINEAQRLIQDGYVAPRTKRPQETTAQYQSVEHQTHPPSPKTKAPEKHQRPRPFAALVIAAAMFFLVLLVSKFQGENHLAKAHQLEEQGQYNESLLYLNKAISQEPHNRGLYLERARLWEKLGKPDRAAVDRKNGTPATTFTLPAEKPNPSHSETNQVPEPPVENPPADVPRT